MRKTGFSLFLLILLVLLFFCIPDLYASIDEYEADNTVETAKQIFPNGIRQFHNFYDSADEDWVKFDGKKDNIYKLAVTSPGISCDPAIEIYNNNKQLIKLVDTYSTGEEESAEFSAESDGVYYARIRQCDTQNSSCHASYGENTEYYLSLTISELKSDGTITGFITPDVKITIITSDYPSGIQIGEKGFYSIVHRAGTYTLTAKADGYEDFQMPITVKECPPAGCTEETATRADICLKPLNSCFKIGDDLTLNFCADYNNGKLGITLNRYYPDPPENGFFWILGNTIPLQSNCGNYIAIGNDLKIPLCVQLQTGQKYQIVLNYYQDKQYWKWTPPGDFNNDGYADLKDAIFVLRIIAGIPVSGAINLNADVNGDHRVGLEDVIYILQVISGLR